MTRHLISRPRRTWSGCLTCAVMVYVTLTAGPTLAAPRWLLVYYRQIGNNVNSNNRTIENHLFREDGTKGANIGVTNQSNPNLAIFGLANADGWCRIDTNLSNFAYDVRIFNPGVATDQSPTFYYQNPQAGKYYSFETQWMYVSDPSRVVPYPAQPVYHYDQVSGLNSPTLQEPPGFYSDAFCVTNCSNYADYHVQTFVVPPGINRIVSVQAYPIRAEWLSHYQVRASIRQGGPSGPQIGPTAIGRCQVAIEFIPVLINWGLQDVPVTPGQAYALRIEPQIGPDACTSSSETGFNAYVTQNNNYAAGQVYNGPTALPNRDLLAIIVGVGYDVEPVNPAVITRSPATLTRSVVRGNNLANDSFTVGNTGGTASEITFSDDATWLFQSSTGVYLQPGETSGPIILSYITQYLAIGQYTGTVTLNGTHASNSPQTLVVNLTVQPPPYAPCDFEPDGDVDLTDFARFQLCLSGAGVAQNLSSCAGARLDSDDDVDGSDLDRFLACLKGADIPVVTTCAD